jgi:hypothetical protein
MISAFSLHQVLNLRISLSVLDPIDDFWFKQGPKLRIGASVEDSWAGGWRAPVR